MSDLFDGVDTPSKDIIEAPASNQPSPFWSFNTTFSLAHCITLATFLVFPIRDLFMVPPTDALALWFETVYLFAASVVVLALLAHTKTAHGYWRLWRDQ